MNKFYTIPPTNHSWCVITKGNQELIKVNEELTWGLLYSTYKELLNLISI